MPVSDLSLALSRLEVGFGLLTRHLEVSLDCRRAEGGPKRAHRLFEGDMIRSGDLRLELSERDVQVVRDVFRKKELVLALESGGSRLQVRSRG